MAVRMREVAEHAGVSVKTVSNVVNDYPHVRPETRARVQRALDDLGYQMNTAARGLRSGKTGMVALAVPQLDIPYFAELAEEVVRAADAVDLTVLVELTDARRDRELKVLEGARRHLVDGVIFSPLGLEDEDIAAASRTFPLVLLGERGLSVAGADHVGIDDARAAEQVTEHLLSLGRRCIAVLGAQRGARTGSGYHRQLGFHRALAAAGLPLRPELEVEVSRYDRAQGAAATKHLLALPGGPPDAVFAFNDALALGALRVLHQRRIAVPRDIAVAGIDDVVEASFSTPTLTSVAPGRRAIAQRAVELLQARILGSDSPKVREVLPHHLKVRESTLTLPEQACSSGRSKPGLRR